MNYDIDKIVADLDQIDFFEDDDLNDDECYYIWDCVCNKTSFNDENAHFGSGASKFVIIPHEGDYVIKIPFRTLGNDRSEYYNYSAHEWVASSPYPLENEYCFLELENYNIAKTCYKGAETFLAKTERVFTGKTINGYVQEKVSDFYCWCDENGVESRWDWDTYDNEKVRVENSYKSAKADSSIDKVFNFYGSIPIVWFDQLFKYAVENGKMDEVEQFFEFLVDTRINDLCARNIGFIGDKPVLMDYAGWYDD